MTKFPDSIVEQAWKRSGGECENCGGELHESSQGAESDYGWEAHHVDPSGPNTLSNCKILCQECHKNTPSYGG